MNRFIKIFICSIILFALFSCKKNNDSTNSVILNDDILFKDFIPDITISSVRYWNNVSGFHLPVPEDSVAWIPIDVDQDSLDDVYISIYTHYVFVSFSVPEANYNYSVHMSAHDSTDSIAVDNNYNPKIKQFIKDSTIPGKSFFNYSGTIYGEGEYTFYVEAPTGDAYYGFKLVKNGGYIYGWVLLTIDPFNKIVTIKEYAINKTLNKPIKAGQKK